MVPPLPVVGTTETRQFISAGVVYKQIRRSRRQRAAPSRSSTISTMSIGRRFAARTNRDADGRRGRRRGGRHRRRQLAGHLAQRWALRAAVAQPQSGGDRPEDQWGGAREQASGHGIAGYPAVPMDLGLQGRVALVTAASSGIGFGIAEALAAEGASLAVSSRTPERIEAAAERLGARPYVFDSMDLDAAPDLIDRVEAELGPLSVLVTNTGGPPGGDPLEFTPRAVGAGLPRARALPHGADRARPAGHARARLRAHRERLLERRARADPRPAAVDRPPQRAARPPSR